MSFAQKHTRILDWGVNTDGFDYVSLEDLYKSGSENVYVLRGLYINKKGKFDDAPVFITDEEYVNIPAHMTAECIDILNSADDVEAIKAGLVGFKVRQYTDKNYGKTCYSVEFVDM